MKGERIWCSAFIMQNAPARLIGLRCCKGAPHRRSSLCCRQPGASVLSSSASQAFCCQDLGIAYKTNSFYAIPPPASVSRLFCQSPAFCPCGCFFPQKSRPLTSASWALLSKSSRCTEPCLSARRLPILPLRSGTASLQCRFLRDVHFAFPFPSDQKEEFL